MLRYLALVWNPQDCSNRHEAARLLARFRLQAPDWKVAIQTDGLVVLHQLPGSSLNAAYPLRNGQGIVLGKLFRKNDAGGPRAHVQALDEKTSAAILATGGRHLVENYWGYYVAFLADCTLGKCRVLRDPTGIVPCQWSQLHGIDLYFTQMEDRERVLPAAISPNHHYLLGHLLYDSACVRETAIEGVETVLAGECVEHDGGRRAVHCLWNPLRLAEQDVIEDPQEAMTTLRQTVLSCIHTWASCFDRIVLRLSGGLDSSIVLASLSCAPTKPQIVCINYYCPDSASADERDYARLAAQRAGCELAEWDLIADFDFAGARHIARTVSPYPCTTNPAAVEREIRFLQAQHADAVFNGVAGDEVFFYGGPAPVTTDYGWRHRLSPRLCAVARNESMWLGRSFWSVLRTAFHFGNLRRPWTLRHSIPRNYRPLMPAAIQREAVGDDSFLHPLYRGATVIPPAKFCQAYSFALTAARIHIPAPHLSSPPELSPLFSQPLLELALRIPTYVLKDGGQDRALARRAFADGTPTEIIRRNTKATGIEYARASIRRNAGLLRELLCDGHLVQQGFLDPVALEAVLSGNPTRNGSHPLELLDYLNVEAWMRGWLDADRLLTA